MESAAGDNRRRRTARRPPQREVTILKTPHRTERDRTVDQAWSITVLHRERSRRRRKLVSFALVAGVVTYPWTAIAQPIGQPMVPPHQPGTVCLTQLGYCNMDRTGYLGAPCSCPTVHGPIRGVIV